jgi:hypothetical protein
MTNYSPLLCALALLGLFANPVQGAQSCWYGFSNATYGQYPPTEQVCDQVGFECQLSKLVPYGTYEMVCVDTAVCQAILINFNANPNESGYESVLCCDTNLCNYYPGQPGTPAASKGTVDRKALAWQILGVALVGFLRVSL